MRRQGFRTLDVKPGNQDLSLTARAQIVNASRTTLLVTFAYNAAARDDVFGSANGVENAVRRFQKDNGLVVDGIVGRNTWNVLKKIG